MRSIRRSMMVYLLGMLLITLTIAGVVVDRVMENALAARTSARKDLIQRQYEERCQRETEKTNEALRNQARTLYSLMYDISRKAWDNDRTMHAMWSLTFFSNPMAASAWTATGNWYQPPPSRPSPPSALFSDAMRKLSQLYYAGAAIDPEYLLQHISENSMEKTDYQQINEQIGDSSGREWHSLSLNGRKFKFDQKEIDSKFPDHGKTPESAAAFDFAQDVADIGPDNEPVQRVILKAPHLTFRFRPPGPNPAGGGSAGGAGRPRPQPSPQPRPSQEVTSLPKLYIQCARPKKILDDALTQLAQQRDDEFAALARDISNSRTIMRLEMLIVGIFSVLAVVIGGYLIVGAGLRPVGKLSVAVSQVSEKDFQLPHDGSDLALELIPIHSRLTQTLDLLRKAFSREKQAMADISHDMRTPIAALLATIDVALRKPRTPEQYRVTLEECRAISKQLGQLVERIMTLARLDAGNDRTEVSRVDAVELAAGCAALIRPLANANDVAVQFHAPDEAIELDTDGGKLREVLMNLLHNAVEYNRPDGTIDLTLRPEGSNAVFEVRDTGIGMTPDVREKIFERFYRADPSRQATGVHAGLGLAIVKAYVARLNGTIAVDSEPGVGTTFRVTLPALPAMPPPMPIAEPATAG